MNIRSFIVAMVLVGLFVSVFGVYFANVSTYYGVDYNESSLESYNKIQNISTQSQTIKEGLESDETDAGLADLVGGFLKKGFAVLKITFQSFGLFESMTSDAITQVDEKAGGGLSLFYLPLITVGVIIFIFLIISVLVGREV